VSGGLGKGGKVYVQMEKDGSGEWDARCKRQEWDVGTGKFQKGGEV